MKLCSVVSKAGSSDREKLWITVCTKKPSSKLFYTKNPANYALGMSKFKDGKAISGLTVYNERQVTSSSQLKVHFSVCQPHLLETMVKIIRCDHALALKLDWILLFIILLCFSLIFRRKLICNLSIWICHILQLNSQFQLGICYGKISSFSITFILAHNFPLVYSKESQT